jgi:hypothetical protein
VALLLVGALPFYAALESRSMNLTLICTLAGLAAGLTNGSFAVLLTDLFPTRVRFTGVALVFNVSFTLFSGTAPLIATALIRDTGQVTSPAYMMMMSAALALAGSIWIERNPTSRVGGRAWFLQLRTTYAWMGACGMGIRDGVRWRDSGRRGFSP